MLYISLQNLDCFMLFIGNTHLSMAALFYSMIVNVCIVFGSIEFIQFSNLYLCY